MYNISDVREKVEKLIGKEVSTVDVPKGAETVQGLSIPTEQSGVRKVIYPDLSLDINACVLDVIEKTNQETPTFEGFSTFEKDKLVLVVQPKTNDDISVVKRPYLDLELVVRKELDNASFKVTKPLLKEWGITEDMLFAIALSNLNKQCRCGDCLNAVGGFGLVPLSEYDFNNMLNVVTRENINFGAGIIADIDALSMIAEKMQDDFYILPSSIHEIMIVNSKDNEIDTLNAMVVNANETAVEPQDRLSNHAYKFDRATQKVIW